MPGAAEYLIHLGDPSVPGTLTQRPASVLSASGRGAILTGIQRMANGITLVAVDARAASCGRSLSTRSFPRPLSRRSRRPRQLRPRRRAPARSPLEGTPSGRHSTHLELTPLAARRRMEIWESDTVVTGRNRSCGSFGG